MTTSSISPDVSDLIIWEADTELRRIRLVGGQEGNLLGYPLAVWNARPGLWLDRLHPDDRERFLSGLRGAADGSINLDIEHRMLAADGTTRWMRTRAGVACDDAGTPGRLVGASIDFTVRRDTDERQHRLRCLESVIGRVSTRLVDATGGEIDVTVLDAMGEIARCLGAQRGITYVLDAAGTALVRRHAWCADGVPPPRDDMRVIPITAAPWATSRLFRGDALQIDDVSTLPPEADEVRRMALRGQASSVLAIPIIHRGTMLGVIQFSAVHEKRAWPDEFLPILKTGGEIIASALRRQAAEETASAAEARYRAIVEDQTELICRFRPDYTLTFINEAYCRYFGRARAELIGLDFRSLIPKDARPGVEAHFADLTAHNPVGSQEHRVVRPDGEIRWQQWTNRALFDQGGILVEFQAVGRDITDRKRAEEELRRSEEAYRLLIEQSPDLMTLIVDGRIQYANAPLAVLSGYTLEEVRGHSPTELLVADDRPRAAERIRQLLAGTPPAPAEYRMLRKDGSVRAVEIYSHKIHYQGRVALLAIIRDVEERKRTEEELRESEEAYRTLIEEHPDLVVLSVDGAVEYANAPLSGLGGYSLAEVRGRSLFDFVTPDDRARARERVARILETGDPSAAEYRLVRKDGTSIHVDVRSQRVRYRGRVGLLSIIRDIEERRRAEDELRASEEAYRTLIEEIPGPVLLVVDGKLDYTNLAFRRMSGYSLEDIRGRSPMEFMPPGDAQRAAERMREILEGGPSYPSEYRAVAKDGALRPIEIRTQRIHYRGKTGLLSIIYDVAERRHTEDALRRHSADLELLVEERTAQIRELERQRAASESTAAIGRMAARVAHEINNPLAGIKNSFLLIKDAVTPDHPYHSYVALIEREIGRIAGIVRQMFDLYRPDQSAAQELRLGPLLGDVATLLEPRCRPRDVRIEVGRTSGDTLYLPPGYMSQVLFNVILNAVEASPSGSVVHVGAIIEPDCATVTVADQGSGIPEDLRERVFEPFFTTKGEGARAGLGLGLSVSRSLMEAMGGSIQFQSRVGEGTTFHLILPRRGPSKEAHRG